MTTPGRSYSTRDDCICSIVKETASEQSDCKSSDVDQATNDTSDNRKGRPMRQSVAATTPSDEKLVLETISTYLQALYKNDKGLFLDAFAETANVSHCSIADEKMTVWSLPDFIEVVDGLHKANGHVEEF